MPSTGSRGTVHPFGKQGESTPYWKRGTVHPSGKQGDCAPFWKARELYTLLENRGTVHPFGKLGDCAPFWESRGTVHAFRKQGLCTLLESRGTVNPFGKQRFRAKKGAPHVPMYRHRPRAPVQPPPSRAGIPLNMSVEIC